jgi:carbon storage regulator
MLVLSRQRDETIMIGDDVELTIVDIRGDKVRIGISAPSSVSVHRKEVYEAIRTENEQAAAISGGLNAFHSGAFPRVNQGGMVPPSASRLVAGTDIRRVTA